LPPEVDTEVQPEPADDIRSSLLSAFDEQASAVETPETSEKPALERPRAPDGKFVKADGQTESEAPAPDSESVAAPVTEPIAAPATPATTEAPPTWKAEDRETFKALPAEAQSILLRRHHEMEADYSRKTQQHSAFIRDYEPVDQLFKPFEQQIRASGFTKAGLIQAWAGVEQQLTAGRGVDVVRDLVQNYKIDRNQIARALGITAAPQADGEPPPVEGQQPVALPPELTQTLQTLEQRQTQFDRFLAQQQQQQQAEATNRVMSTIEAFRDAKDPSGALLHPHYDTLEADMVAHLAAARNMGQEPTLDELYQKAVWANTSTREQMLASQTAAQEAQRVKAEQAVRAQARTKAEQARRAGSSVTGAPGSSQAAIAAARAEGGSLRDTLLAAVEEHADAA
jgi:hypothetical protein